MATKPLPGIAPVSSENLQFVIPVDSVGEPPLVAPVSQENMQFVMPEVREPSMYEMTRDFDEFKSYYKAGAFDSDVEGVGDVADIAWEGGKAIASDVGSWLGTLPIRLMQNFTDDKYEFNRRAKAEAKATTLQTLGSLRENYEALGAGIKRGVYKMTEDEGSDLDLYSAWKYWQKTADLENQRQGLAAEVLADGIFGISGDAWTAGMTDEEKKWIREGTVKPDVQSAMGGAMIADPLNYLPVGVAFRGATGGGKAALTGAERVLLKETQELVNLQAGMQAASKKSYEWTKAGAKAKASLAEINAKIAANSAKLAPLAQKRSIALNAMKDSLPEGSAMRGLLDDALADVPISAGRNITGIAAASAPVVAGKAIETLGNVGAFLKMLPYETAVNTVMKIAEKAGKEISEETAKKLLIGGAVFGTGYASTGRSDSGALEFQLPDIGKVELAAAASAILGPAFLKRFGRDLAIAGRQLANTKETLPYFGALAAKGSEKLVDQVIDRDVLVPVASVARRVTGAAEGKIPQRMFLPQGKLGPASSGIATFMDRSGLGRYAETAGRAARGGAHGAAVTGAFGLAASGGMENPEAFYGSLGVGAILGTAGSTFGSVARFDSPAQHWTARYGDYEYYVKNYLGEGQKENFNKLNRDLQIAVAHKIVTNPALAVEFVSKGKTAGGGHLNRLTNAMEINVDSPRAAEALLSHEFTHYLEQTGGKLAFNELLIGNPILGKPGMFVERVTPETKSKYPDLNVGDPIMVGEEGARRYKLSEEFETARKEYKEKLKDTDEFSNLTEEQLDLIMTDELVVSEIVAEHGTDFFANDRRRYRDLHRGAIGKVMEGLLETQLASNVPFLRKALAMFGGTFRPDGRLITDNALFSKLKRYPQITELVRKYNRRAEGLSPEQMKKKTASVDGDGNVISPKDVVVDVTGAELSKNPELVDLIRAGTFLQIDKDGNVIPNLAMTSREKGKYNRSFAQSLKDAIERQEADTGLPEGHVKPEVNEKTGKVKFVGRYLDDSVLDAVEKSGNWNKEQIAMLREANNNIKNRGGNEFLISYFKAAHQGGRRYINAKVENLVEVPYGIEITQQGNVLIRTVSVDQLIKNVDQLTRQQQRELTRLYGADLNAAKAMLLNDVDAYHRNHAAGEPGRTGLDSDQAIAKAKADFINSAFGSGTKAQVDANPWRAGLGKKQPRDVYRSRRIERIGKITQLSGERYVDYNLINKAFMPRRKPGQPDDTIPLPFPELPGDIPGEGFGRMINVDKTKSEMAEAKRLADEAQSGFSSAGNVRSKDAYGRDKLFMPADDAYKKVPLELQDDYINFRKYLRSDLEVSRSTKKGQTLSAPFWLKSAIKDIDAGKLMGITRKLGREKVVNNDLSSEQLSNIAIDSGIKSKSFAKYLARRVAGGLDGASIEMARVITTQSNKMAPLLDRWIDYTTWGINHPITSKPVDFYDARLYDVIYKSLKEEGQYRREESYGEMNRRRIAEGDKLFMPAAEAGASKGKQAEAAKLWQEKGTDSPFFRRWFGRSKTLEYQGTGGKTPLPWIHYGSLGHGGPDSRIPSGEIWVSRPQLSEWTAPHGYPERGQGAGKGMTQLYVRANKIWDWRNDAHLNALTDQITAHNKKVDFKGRWSAENYKKEVRKSEGSASTLKETEHYIKELGFDAAQIGRNGELVIFDAAKNVKSADNRGTFSPAEGNILFMPAESKGQPKKILLRTKQEISDAVDSLAAERGISRNDALNELLNSALLDPKRPESKRSEGDITLALTPEEIALLEKTEIGPEESAEYKAAIAKRRAISEREIGVKNRLYMPAISPEQRRASKYGKGFSEAVKTDKEFLKKARADWMDKGFASPLFQQWMAESGEPAFARVREDGIVEPIKLFYAGKLGVGKAERNVAKIGQRGKVTRRGEYVPEIPVKLLENRDAAKAAQGEKKPLEVATNAAHVFDPDNPGHVSAYRDGISNYLDSLAMWMEGQVGFEADLAAARRLRAELSSFADPVAMHEALETVLGDMIAERPEAVSAELPADVRAVEAGARADMENFRLKLMDEVPTFAGRLEALGWQGLKTGKGEITIFDPRRVKLIVDQAGEYAFFTKNRPFGTVAGTFGADMPSKRFSGYGDTGDLRFMPAAKLYGPVENIGGIRLKKNSRYGPTNTAVVGRGKAAKEYYIYDSTLPDEVAAEAIKKHNDYGGQRLLHYVADGDFETKAPKSLKAWTDIQKRLTAEIQRERNVAKNAAQESKEFLAKYGKSADNLLSWRSDATRQYGTDYDGLVYRGEKSDKAANIKKDGIKTKWEESSNISKSMYPLLKIELENGTSFYEQVRISDHDQVSANAPRYYEYDYRAKDFMEAFPKIEEDMQGLAWDMWAEQKEYLEGLK